MKKAMNPVKLVEYNFNNSTVNPSYVKEGINSYPITASNLGSFEIFNTSYATRPVLQVSPYTGSINAEDSQLKNIYFSIILDNISRITEINFKVARGGSSTTRGVALKSNYDNYSSFLMNIDTIPTERPILSNFSIKTSINATYLELKFYIFTSGAGSTVEFDDIIIYGN